MDTGELIDAHSTIAIDVPGRKTLLSGSEALCSDA